MSSSLTFEQIIELHRNRWMVPLLADLAAHNGARFVEMVNRLGIARDSLVRTLQTARDAGWVIPNPGYGHPLRPEYILSESGHAVSGIAGALVGIQRQMGLDPGALTRWGVPLVHAIDRGHRRFNALSRILTPASPRAVSQGLRTLTEHRLVARDLVDGFPPIGLYDLTDRGKMISTAIG